MSKIRRGDNQIKVAAKEQFVTRKYCRGYEDLETSWERIQV